MLTAPSRNVPAASSRSTAVAVAGAIQPLRIFEPHSASLPLRVVHVLVRDRHAVQRAFRLAGRERAVGGLRGLQRILGLDARERVERRLPLVDAREQRLGDFHGRHLAPPDRGGEVLQVHLCDIAHRLASFICTTRKLDGSVSSGIAMFSAA